MVGKCNENLDALSHRLVVCAIMEKAVHEVRLQIYLPQTLLF